MYTCCWKIICNLSLWHLVLLLKYQDLDAKSPIPFKRRNPSSFWWNLIEFSCEVLIGICKVKQSEALGCLFSNPSTRQKGTVIFFEKRQGKCERIFEVIWYVCSTKNGSNFLRSNKSPISFSADTISPTSSTIWSVGIVPSIISFKIMLISWSRIDASNLINLAYQGCLLTWSYFLKVSTVADSGNYRKGELLSLQIAPV